MLKDSGVLHFLLFVLIVLGAHSRIYCSLLDLKTWYKHLNGWYTETILNMRKCQLASFPEGLKCFEVQGNAPTKSRRLLSTIITTSEMSELSVGCRLSNPLCIDRFIGHRDDATSGYNERKEALSSHPGSTVVVINIRRLACNEMAGMMGNQSLVQS